ncbi:YicC/YloC family endoribonuclease [Amaricoccus tamworthensis]|uniref:YicC/YloC family endoribonuclease n=1 Tax=Amaricoccus tamworthensis TaxID=57002 RepID=UPI003C7C6C88
MPLNSMTGFADHSGTDEETSWVWEARSVNGRGLEIRLRLPDGFESLEPVVRTAVSKAFSRGNISVSLKLGRRTSVAAPRLNPAVLEEVISGIEQASTLAAERGLDLMPPTIADLLSMRGVMETDTRLPSDSAELMAALKAGISDLVSGLKEARATEGASLQSILSEKLDTITQLCADARKAAEESGFRSGEVLRARLQTILDNTADMDESRIAQELAVIAVKADVSEELDRLDAHLSAARDLLKQEGPVGRKLDFLTQEFNREANTLCSKAGSTDLKSVGLELKVVIDQMREQVQNVE